MTVIERRKLAGLRPQTYEHPSDSQALDALQNTRGLETLVRKCNEWGIERMLRVQLTGSHLRVSADSFPSLFEQVTVACDLLDLPRRPDLYIAAGEQINAFTAGVERPIVVLYQGAIDRLSEEELFFVIAHELGHIKSGHVLFHQIADYLPFIGEIVGNVTLGLGGYLSAGLEMALLRWKRMSEFTADRAGLLASQDANVGITALMKIAGLPHKYYGAMNPEDFIAQAREFSSLDLDKLNWLAKWVSALGQSHPWTVLRASELLTWIDGGQYDAILKQSGGLNRPPERFCTQCGRPLPANGRFCPHCGATKFQQAEQSLP